MEKKGLRAVLLATAFTCLVACVSPAPTASVTATSSQTVSAASSKEETASFGSARGGELFSGILAQTPETGVMNVIDQDGASFQVDASDRAVDEIWNLLKSGNFSALDVTDDLFKGAYDTISLSFSKDQNQYLIKLYGCGDTHPAYPGRTVIDLESHGNGESSFQSYIGGLTVFEQLSVLVNQLRGTLKVILSEPFVKLETGGLKGKTLTAWLEMNNRIMCAFTEEEGNHEAMLFDTETGALLGTTRVAEPVLRMEPSRDESGFDYQMYTASRIVYKNSRDPVAEKAYTLPSTVTLETWKDGDGDFAVKGGTLVWAAEDGIYTAAANGSEAKKILEAGEVPALAGALAPEGAMRLVAPRLLNEGAQAVVPVLANEKLAGVVLVDLEGSAKTGYFDVFGKIWKFLDYPDKRTFAAAGERDVTVVEGASGESKRLSFAHNDETEWYSGDYSTFIVSEPAKDTLFTSWLVSARKPQDRSRAFLTVKGRGTFRPVGASERRLLAYVADDAGARYVLIKY